MKYDWAYLCCHEKFLEMTLRHLPNEPFDGLDTMHVCYQGHQFKGLGERLELIATAFAPQWLKMDINDVSMAVWLAAEILEIDRSPFQHYYMNEKDNIALGAKLMLPIIFKGPLLFTDDDVLVLQDPKRLLDNSFCTAHGFNRLGMTIPGVRIANNLRDVFDAERDFSVYDYNEHAVDGGIWFINNDRERWDEFMRRFWHSPCVASMKTDNTEFRCCDQRFITMYGRTYGWKRLTSTKDRRIYLTALDKQKVKFDVPFIHYGASSHKDEYIEHFKERLRCGL